MTWRLPDTYHLAGHGRGTATIKFYEGRDILHSPARQVRGASLIPVEDLLLALASALEQRLGDVHSGRWGHG
jgi:hypothetical protein